MPSTSVKPTKRAAGKENAPPARGTDYADEADFDDMDTEETTRPTSKGAAASKGGKPRAKVGNDDSSGESALRSGGVGLQRRLEQITAERDRYRAQSEQFAKQFEELSSLRQTEAEKLLKRYQEKADVQSAAQNDIIANLTAINEKQQAKIRLLEDQARADAPKPDPKEIKALKEQLDKAKAELKSRTADYAKLEKEYQTEKQYSQNLQASRSGKPQAVAPATVAEVTEESAKDSASLRLYEDLTDLAIINVKIAQGEHGPRDKVYTFHCLMTLPQASLSFYLTAYSRLNREKLKSKKPNPWEPLVNFKPDLKGETNQGFIARLGEFQHVEGFDIPREQLNLMFEQLRATLKVEE